MRPFPRELLTAASRQHGLLTAADLDVHGYGGRARHQAIEAGALVRLHRGVYRLGSHPETFEQRCRAALFAAPDAALSGPTAGRLWNLRGVSTDDVHLIARRAISLRGVHAHRTDLLRAGDVVERFGVRLLRPARLLCDLARFLDVAELESVFEQMLDRKDLTIRSARTMARQFCRPGRPGTVEVAHLLDSRPEWLKPVGSDLELRVWRGLAGRGYVLDRQVAVDLGDGRAVRIDLASRPLRVGIEVDHQRWHDGRLDSEGDKRRDRLLTALGWTVVRVTDDDVERRYAATIHELACLLDARTAAHNAAS